MKYLAFLLSFHILMLTEMPVVATLYAKMASEQCGKACSDVPDSDDEAEGCSKESCLTSPCCKIQLFLTSFEKPAPQFLLVPLQQNNFNLKRLLITLSSFDIWHPPQFI